MSSSTRFGDFPHYVPTGRSTIPTACFTGWMLLSYRKAATASSTMGSFAAARATDENPRTFWVAGAQQAGRDADARSRRGENGARGAGQLRRLQVGPLRRCAGHLYRVRAAILARRRTLAADRTHRAAPPRPSQRLFRTARAGPRAIRPLRPRPCRRANLAISDLRVFGNADGPPPAMPKGLRGARQADRRNADIAWRPVPGVTGYNVRWGLRPDRLTLTYQLFADLDRPDRPWRCAR